MKHFSSFFCGLFLSLGLMGQVPQAFNYQAVLRNNSGQIISGTKVGLRLSVIQNSTAVYVETHSPTTNTVGLVNVKLGSGTVVSGTFASIDWSLANYSLRVELDAAGGTDYVLFGTSPFLSVPYAQLAAKANAVSWANVAGKPTGVSQFANDAGYLKTESDPLFSASLAKKITPADTLRWGKKLPAGVSGDFLTYDGTNWISRSYTTNTVGANVPINNMQPYLALNYCIALEGIYPSRNALEPFIAEILLFGGNFAPRGYAECNGQLMSIAQNTALFSLLGTTYGGNGQTTFALPDLRGRAPIHYGSAPGLTPKNLGDMGGSENVTLTVPNLPAHNHTIIQK